MAPQTCPAPRRIWAKPSCSPFASQAIAASRSFLGSGNFCDNDCELTTARLNHVEILSRSTVGTGTWIGFDEASS